jgi:undecaprenyl diphosphate synthase
VTGLHVALIMDGNGRWAQRQGKPRSFGHRAGVEAVRRVIEAAPALGIQTLTLYAFSADNWRRPPAEVAALMRLLRIYLWKETATFVRNGIRVSFIGRRDRLPREVLLALESAEQATRQGTKLHVRVALDYSARESILRAVELAQQADEDISRDNFAALLARAEHQAEAAPDVDLLIRTSGEQRLSDFLLWECAYAELYFTPCLWPDFGRAELETALATFAQRERRYGGLMGINGARAKAVAR